MGGFRALWGVARFHQKAVVRSVVQLTMRRGAADVQIGWRAANTFIDSDTDGLVLYWYSRYWYFNMWTCGAVRVTTCGVRTAFLYSVREEVGAVRVTPYEYRTQALQRGVGSAFGSVTPKRYLPYLSTVTLVILTLNQSCRRIPGAVWLTALSDHIAFAFAFASLC